MITYYKHAEALDAGFYVSAGISDLSISAAALALSTQKPTTKKDATNPICRYWITQRGLVGKAEVVPCPESCVGQMQTDVQERADCVVR